MERLKRRRISAIAGMILSRSHQMTSAEWLAGFGRIWPDTQMGVLSASAKTARNQRFSKNAPQPVCRAHREIRGRIWPDLAG